MTGTENPDGPFYGTLPPKKALGFSLKVAGAIRSRPERARGPREAEFESKTLGSIVNGAFARFSGKDGGP